MTLADQFRAAAERCCQCTDGHHDWIPDYPYGTDGDVRLTRDLARKVADLLDKAAAHDAEVAARARAEVREAIGQRRDWIPCERVPELQARALREAADQADRTSLAGTGPMLRPERVADWLRARADALAAFQGVGESGEGER